MLMQLRSAFVAVLCSAILSAGIATGLGAGGAADAAPPPASSVKAKKALKKATKALKAARVAQDAVGNISVQYATGFSTVFPGGYGGAAAVCPDGSHLLDVGADFADRELRLVQQGPVNSSLAAGEGERGVVIYHNPSSVERLFRVTATCLRGVGATP